MQCRDMLKSTLIQFTAWWQQPYQLSEILSYPAIKGSIFISKYNAVSSVFVLWSTPHIERKNRSAVKLITNENTVKLHVTKAVPNSTLWEWKSVRVCVHVYVFGSMLTRFPVFVERKWPNRHLWISPILHFSHTYRHTDYILITQSGAQSVATVVLEVIHE